MCQRAAEWTFPSSSTVMCSGYVTRGCICSGGVRLEISSRGIVIQQGSSSPITLRICRSRRDRGCGDDSSTFCGINKGGSRPESDVIQTQPVENQQTYTTRGKNLKICIPTRTYITLPLRGTENNALNSRERGWSWQIKNCKVGVSNFGNPAASQGYCSSTRHYSAS